MLYLYLNTTDRTWFDGIGNPLPDEQPQIPFGNTETVSIQCCVYTPNAGTPGVVPENEWYKDEQFNLPGVTALLSVDNNFLRYLKGTLKNSVTAGDINSAVFNIPNATIGKIAKTGAVRFYDNAGNIESVEYINRSVNGTEVTFFFANGSKIEYDYAVGAAVDCPEMVYAQSAMNAELSMPSQGLFVFDITMNSPKLQEKVSYSDTSFVDDIKGLELLIFTVENDVIQTRNAYLCDTFTVPIPMATPNPNPQMPDTYADNVAAIASALISAGLDVEQRNNNGNIELRIKISNLGDDSWSDWSSIGYSLKIQYSENNSSWHDIASANDKYLRTSIDGGKTWSVGLQLSIIGGEISEEQKEELLNELEDRLLNGEWGTV